MATAYGIDSGNSIFRGCTGLTSITVDPNNNKYNDGNGSNCIILTSNNTLLVGCKNTIIPGTIIKIGSYAFYDCSELTSITLPVGITNIDAYAFYGCTGLTSIILPSTITSFGSRSFENCTGLTHVTFNCNVPNYALSITASGSPFYNCTNINSVTLGEGVISIATRAFEYCDWLTSITLPSTITSISSYVFTNCPNLAEITSLNTTPPTITASTLPGVGIIQHIYVPNQSVTDYQGASYWNSYAAWIEAIA